ncbi:MAG TPA: MATE family efflux transporter [Polyangiales bacterium]|nr:MATE family efflux transporter [Polyangiales bacterium]
MSAPKSRDSQPPSVVRSSHPPSLHAGVSVSSRSSAPPPEAAGFFELVRLALSGVEQDFTELPLRRAVFLLAVPMVMEMAMESLFAIADIFWVSRLGAHAVATVGLTESLLAMIYAVAVGLSLAATATVARRVGERDLRGASVAAAQVLSLAVVVSIAIGVAGVAWGGTLLEQMGAAPEVLAMGSDYARIMLGGSISVVLLFAFNAVFRGAGDATTAMHSLWLANLANIILGPIFIFGFGPVPAYGVTGAAVATTLGRSLGVCYQLWRMLRRSGRLQVMLSDLRPRMDVISGLLRISGTGTLQTMLETASWLGLVRILSSFGSVALAGYTIAMRIAIFALLPSWGLSNAAATLVGQNLGANKPERAERAVWSVGLYNLIFLGGVSVVFVGLPGPIAGLFTSDPQELRYAVDCLRTVAFGFLCYAYGMVIVQAFNGAGDTRTPTLLNLACFWCFKIPLAYVLALPLGMGPDGVFLSVTAAYSLLALLAVLLFRRGTWKTQRV